MDRLGNPELDERFWDANDCRSMIATALAEKPFDEEALHRCVESYVGAARIAGRSASDVIVALTELVERTDIAPASVRHALIRHVIPWCVEAYFGRGCCDALPTTCLSSAGHRLDDHWRRILSDDGNSLAQ